MNTQHTLKFEEILIEQYRLLFKNDPEYAYAASRTTPEALAAKMTAGLIAGTANKEGDGIFRTCKALAIKHTYKAIKEYLTK
jgi:hypothetical protein